MTEQPGNSLMERYSPFRFLEKTLGDLVGWSKCFLSGSQFEGWKKQLTTERTIYILHRSMSVLTELDVHVWPCVLQTLQSLRNSAGALK